MTQADAHVVVGEREGAASVEAGVRAFPQSVGGSAWRRRQRRLRSMGRFVAQSVRVALATTSHHSFDSRAGGSTVRTVDQRVSELERMLETDLVSRIAAVELLVETLQGDMSRGRSVLDSALDARLSSVSDEMNSNVAAVSEALQVDISRSCSKLGSALEALQADISRARSDFGSALEARFSAVSGEFFSKVEDVAVQCRRSSGLVAKLHVQVSDCVRELPRLSGAVSVLQQDVDTVSGLSLRVAELESITDIMDVWLMERFGRR